MNNDESKYIFTDDDPNEELGHFNISRKHYGLLRTDDGYLAYWTDGDELMYVKDTHTQNRTMAECQLVSFMENYLWKERNEPFDRLLSRIVTMNDSELKKIERVIQSEFTRRNISSPYVNMSFRDEWYRKRIVDEFKREDMDGRLQADKDAHS